MKATVTLTLNVPAKTNVKALKKVIRMMFDIGKYDAVLTLKDLPEPDRDSNPEALLASDLTLKKVDVNSDLTATPRKPKS